MCIIVHFTYISAHNENDAKGAFMYVSLFGLVKGTANALNYILNYSLKYSLKLPVSHGLVKPVNLAFLADHSSPLLINSNSFSSITNYNYWNGIAFSN